MGLLRKLKSLLGLEDDRSQVSRTESGVTIEREPDESAEPRAEAESAVKGVDASAEESTDTARREDADGEATPDAETGDVTGVEEAETSEAEDSDTEAEDTDAAAGDTDAEAEEDAEAGVSTADVTTAPEAESVEAEREEAAEPAEAVGPSTEASEPDQTAGDEPEPTPEDTEDEDPEPDAAADEPVGEGEPLEDVKGIGPAYAERLRDAGVADVTELAKADAELLAEETGLSEKRISTWVERAQTR